MTENINNNIELEFSSLQNDADASGRYLLNSLPDILPVLPLKDIVIFPYMVFPILAGRESTIKAINKSTETDKYIFLVSQIDPKLEEPSIDNLYTTGTIAKILQVLRLPNGLIKVLVDGLVIANSTGYIAGEYISSKLKIKPAEFEDNNELRALEKRSSKFFSEYISSNPSIPKETLEAFENIFEPDRKLFYIASALNVDVQKKQVLLEKNSLKDQYYELLYILNSEIEVLNIEKDIDAKIYQAMQKNQRKFIVQEQIRILQEELGDGTELDPDLIKIREQIEISGMPDPIMQKAMEEFNKLRKTPQMSPDFGVLRNYLDWMVNVPWNKITNDNFDLKRARKVLDEDHYDLEKPKERIIELIAVLKLLKEKNIKKPPKGQILCLVGPPGVGKTSLGKSIARTLDRKFTRISVGGIKDEAEIRGHRRTYIGSMPGKIIQAMKKAGT